MSIQYEVLGFEPMTFRTFVSSHNYWDGYYTLLITTLRPTLFVLYTTKLPRDSIPSNT